MQRHWQTLEYPKILERLARYADFSAGAELALQLEPQLDLHAAREALRLTREARALLLQRPEFSLSGISDIRPHAIRAEQGALLEPLTLLEIRATLEGAERVQRILLHLSESYPGLADIAARIVPLPHIPQAITHVLDDRGEVRDDASPELARIRAALRVTQERIQERLRRLIADGDTARHLQEAVITRREGRFVVPVKAEARGHIPGVVHDRSASGATLFIEPLAVVEMNNALRELKLAEEEEIYRLLAELSRQVAAAARPIIHSLDALAELDLTLAKARYAEDMLATEPELLPIPTEPPAPRDASLHPGTVIRLPGARHPLLDPRKVVPVNLIFDEQTHILVITGPNTGGKTVSLKTLGLLTLMAQAGMHIPADEGAALSFFEHVYADIGDEQSIEQSLSTFSGHLANILSFLERLDHRDLVVLDELGAGTDPTEGAALAQALLEYLRQKRVTAAVATHYPELKLYAHETPGVTNAAMEFDVETLAPTYRLEIGLPGRSNAFAIARRLGMPEPILRAAQAKISGQARRVEDMLDDLHTLRLEAARERDALRAARQEMEARAAELQARLAAIEEERRSLLKKSAEQAEQELEALREEVRRVRTKLERLPWPTAPEVREEVRAIAAETEQLAEKLPEVPPPPIVGADDGPPRVGDTVRLRTLGAEGELLALEDTMAQVKLGAARLRVPLEQVELVARAAPTPAGPRQAFKTPPPSPGLQLDLRGMLVEDALARLDRYLDNAARAGLPWVRIVHGKGTGALRRAVRHFLDEHPLVTSYEAAREAEGGEGATIAHLLRV